MTDTVSNIPAPSAPMLLPNGSLSPAWFQFFIVLFNRTGGGVGVDVMTLITRIAQLESEVVDLQAQIDKLTPAGYINATAANTKRRLAYYNEG